MGMMKPLKQTLALKAFYIGGDASSLRFGKSKVS